MTERKGAEKKPRATTQKKRAATRKKAPPTQKQLLERVDALHLEMLDVMAYLKGAAFVEAALTAATDMLIYAVLVQLDPPVLHHLLSTIPARERRLVGDSSLQLVLQELDAETRPYVESLLTSRLDLVDSAFVALQQNVVAIDSAALADDDDDDGPCDCCGGPCR